MRFKHLKKIQTKGHKELAILIDPDELGDKTPLIVTLALQNQISWFLVGGSLLSVGNTQKCVNVLKELNVPNVLLFPGNEIQLVPNADALLFMTLISGRNPEYLISKQVAAAPWVKQSKIETIPTGYMLVESGKLTSAQYMSGSIPIPYDKPDIAAATAMAGELLGLQLLYIDAGSGAQKPIPEKMIKAVRHHTDCILFVGGGMKSPEDLLLAWQSGADITVVGNGIFKNPNLITELAAARDFYNQNITL
jgi:phosphoglycerol geranylgeranyltransferase